MSTAALEAAMAGMEAARAALEAAASRVGDEMSRLQEQVAAANGKAVTERLHIANEARKRRRRSGGAAAAAQGDNPDAAAEAAFETAFDAADERLQAARPAMARAHAATQAVRAAVDSAKSSARELVSPERLAELVEARNQGCNELVRLMRGVDVGGSNHAVILGFLSVVTLWRLKGVSRAFRRWGSEQLSSLPRVVCVGGTVEDRSVEPPENIATASAVVLNLSTMRWSSAGCMPALPDPRAEHKMNLVVDGSVVVCCGFNAGAADQMHHLMKTALRWSPGGSEWVSLPDLPEEREAPACVSLPDGRTLVIGGLDEDMDDEDDEGEALASVVTLAAGGSEWSALAPMGQARWCATAAVLPDGKVLVAGGRSANQADSALKTGELYDPATNAWTALPDMAHERSSATACMLPSGRVAVLGGVGADGHSRKNCEAFDPVKRTWEPLPAMNAERVDPAAEQVAGGMVVVGEETVELFDEESGRWLALPHAMAQPRLSTQLVSLPAPVLLAAEAGH